MKKIVISLFVLICLSLSSASASESIQTHKIGVVVYDINDYEVQMFRNYYENYIAASFPVDFIYSSSISNWNDEEAFIKEALDSGAEGFISFIATDLPQAVSLCADSKAYYMLGSGNISQDLFDQVADNPSFLGCIGPDDETDYQAGADMVNAYLEYESSVDNPHFLITTGGSLYGNHMHEMRAKGILAALEENYGYQYPMTIDEMIMTADPIVVETGIDGITIGICPGYDVSDKLELTLGQYEPDAVLSVLASDALVPLVSSAEKENGHDIWVGVVDCFSQWNQDFFQEEDSFGHSRLNYVAGKYGSLIGPSFAAMFQALTGHVSLLRPDGKAFHINQGFWTADSPKRYNELFGYTQSFALNAYSNTDLMSVIEVYNPDTTYEAFKTLTEAFDEEQAFARMGI